MAETPSTEQPRRRVPTVIWIAGALTLAALVLGVVLLHLAHASRVLDAPLALQIKPATAPAAPASAPAAAPATRAPVESAPVSAPAQAPPARAPGDVAAAEKLLKHGRPAAALAAFQQALAQNADDVRALRGACTSLGKLGRLDDGARVCRRALDRAPDDVETRRALATIYFNGGAYKWSASEWRRVVAAHPHDAHARRALRAAERLASKG